MGRIYKETPHGEILELANPQARTADDVHVFRPLSGRQRSHYRSLRKSGASDSGIWRAIHAGDIAAHASKTSCKNVPIAVESLTKGQLTELVVALCDEPVNGLCRLSKAALIKLVRALAKGSDVSLTLV